ncbi:MAG: hypothetical protein M2R45_05424 [Verrucomicrobia subdivision 3 bacterium]|nr:hypothetical protein [Limisphaerales bacterium]MCS1413002.1 hypothetical protein [Limisphaerales bacterium]
MRFIAFNMPLLIAITIAEACSLFEVIDYRHLFGETGGFLRKHTEFDHPGSDPHFIGTVTVATE